MPPAKSDKLSAEVQKKIEAIRKQKKALPKGMEPVPKDQVAISDQIHVLTNAGLQTIPMDKVRVYQGDKVIEINKPQFMGNIKTNIWSATGAEMEKPASEVPTQGLTSSDLMKIISGLPKLPSGDSKAEEVEHTAESAEGAEIVETEQKDAGQE